MTMPNPSEDVWNAIIKIPASLKSIARSILPDAAGGTDASGGHVDSLTEAVMGMTSALVSIAEALNKEWPGLAKLNEESGELVQVIGKLMMTHGERAHWGRRRFAQTADRGDGGPGCGNQFCYVARADI